MPSLVVTSGALTGQVFTFSETAVVGRGQFSDVRLNDPTVSRRHALIRRVGDDYELTDQDSANGTRHRGQRLAAPVKVQDGDELEFGEVKTVFRRVAASQDSLPSHREVEEIAAAPVAAGGRQQRSAEPGVPAPAQPPGLRELLARLKLFCDVGALARRE
ncbi:MAG TPA: FHA domain-containing protein, partial [Rudaea sp.]|nr:FHA domain-containing protein [Rudaea sp.]